MFAVTPRPYRLAGEQGIEPQADGLEPTVLPLHYTPNINNPLEL